MASSAEGASNGLEESFSASPVTDAEQLYDLGCAAMLCDAYDEASEFFSKALDIRVELYGELSPQNALTFYKYGCALLYKAQAETEAVVERSKGEASTAEGSKAPENVEESDDEEDDKNEGEGMAEEEETGEEEEGDLELAWKVLDCARVIYAKDAKRTLAEVDVITTLADVSLEQESFQPCFDDYNTALSLLETLVEADDRRIAELCFKISLAKQLAGAPQEALDYCKRAISACERRLERLSRELPTEQTAGKGVMVTGKRPVESVSDGGDVAQVIDSKPSLEAELMEVVEDGGKLASSENLAESGGDGGKAQVEDPELPSQAALKAEVKEIDELLVDLREKVEELQQMANAPSLSALDQWKSSNPVAAVLMAQAYSRQMGIATVENGGSGAMQAGSSSTAPVTNLGVMGRGVKRATPTPIVDEQSSEVQPKKRTTEDVLQGGSSGETQIGFNGHS